MESSYLTKLMANPDHCPTCDTDLAKTQDASSEKPLAQEHQPVHNVLTERESTYGDYSEGACLAKSIKQVLKESKNWDKLTPAQEYSVDMIANKLSRILNGDTGHVDSWVDIAGYATLVADILQKNKE
jgi:hypothetical protein